MKTRTRNRVAAVLLTCGISVPAQAAPTCFAPEPACALVLLGALVTTVAHERDEQETEDGQARWERLPPRAGVGAVQPTGRPAPSPASHHWTMRDARH
jgi:hypothetical protein